MSEAAQAERAARVLRGGACGACAHRFPVVIWEGDQPGRRTLRCGLSENDREVDPEDGCSLFQSYRHEHLGQGVEQP